MGFWFYACDIERRPKIDVFGHRSRPHHTVAEPHFAFRGHNVRARTGRCIRSNLDPRHMDMATRLTLPRDQKRPKHYVEVQSGVLAYNCAGTLPDNAASETALASVDRWRPLGLKDMPGEPALANFSNEGGCSMAAC